MTKLGKTAKKRYFAAARKSPLSPGMKDAIASKWTEREQRIHKNRKLGTFGAASEVVMIDPKDWKEPTP